MRRLVLLLVYQCILVLLPDRTLVRAATQQVTNVDIPSYIPEHTKIENSQSSLQEKETVSQVQETETLTVSSNLITSLPIDQSETSSIKEGSLSSAQVEPSFTDIQGTSQTEQYLAETVKQSTSVVQSESLLYNDNTEVANEAENGKSVEESEPLNDAVENSEHLRAVDPEIIKDPVKVTETEVKDTENLKVTETVKVTEESVKDVEASRNLTQTKENIDQSDESFTASQKQPSSQTSGEEPATLEQRLDGEPVEVQTEEKQEEEGLTFSEWRQKVMAEDEKGKLEGNEESPTLQVPPGKQRKRKNYASQECGAKILASNPEASSPKSVLNSNRDEYMNNPCKAKRWFVVELCEPIKAHSVDIASLELFSSQPKKFKIFLSDRYPTKDWKSVGEFTLKEERSMQNFTLKEAEDYFAKFARVELTEHYGNEHFCPLTIFRVLGIAVEDDYEDDPSGIHDDDDDDSDNDDSNESETETGSKNLFTSAKDTVINIVKKVLNVDSEEDQIIQNGTQLLVSRSADNSSVNGTVTTDQQSTLPCVPVVTSDASEEKKCRDEEGKEDQPKHTLPLAPEPGKTDSKIVVKLADDEQVETTPDATPGKSLDAHMIDCFHVMHTLAISEKKNCVRQSKLCDFVYMVRKLSPVKQLSKTKKKDEDVNKAKKDAGKILVSNQNDKSKQAINSTIPVQVTHIEPDEAVGTITDSVTDSSAKSGTNIVQSSKVSKSKFEQDSDIEKNKPDLQKTASLTASSIEIQPTSSTKEVVATSTKVLSTTQTGDHASVKQTGSATSLKIEQKEPTESEKIEPSPTVVETTGEMTPDTSREATPVLPESWKPNTKDLLQEKSKIENQKTLDGTVTQTDIKEKPGSSSETIQSKESKAPSQVNGESVQSTEAGDTSASASNVEETEDLETLVEDIQEQKSNTTVIDDKVVVSNGGQQKRDDLNLVKLPAIPSGKRESAIMRLSNRIKVLEQNVSLSSRFLEELSRRYKKQSEDMMKMLNKTMATMHNMTVEADVKNKLHEDEMSAMERRLENLTEIVHKLTKSFDKLNQQVTDRQMIWTSIEIAIIVFMLLFLHFRRKRVNLPPEVRSLIESMPSKPSSSYPQRRNSLSGPATPSKEKHFGKFHSGGGLQRFNSETALDSTEASSMQNSAEFPFKPGSDGIKKKKKKKHKNLEARLSSSSSGSSVIPSNSSSQLSSLDSANNEFQFNNTILQSLTTGNQSTKETSQFLAKNKFKEAGAPASCKMSQNQSSCFGSFLSGLSITSSTKQRSSSLGTEVTEAKELKTIGENFAKSAQKEGGFGAKIGTKGLTKKPPVSGSSKISPNLNLKISKLSVNGSMNGNVDQREFRLDDRKVVKGHRRQKSLPKQNYSSVETVGSVSHESASNCLQGTSQRFETIPLSNKGQKRGEIKKSASLPVSPDGDLEKLPVHSKSFANGYYDKFEIMNDRGPERSGFSLAKSKSEHSCSDIYGKNMYNSEYLLNGASGINGTVSSDNTCSGSNQLNGCNGKYSDVEHERDGSGPMDVDRASAVQNGRNGIWKNVFGYFK